MNKVVGFVLAGAIEDGTQKLVGLEFTVKPMDEAEVAAVELQQAEAKTVAAVFAAQKAGIPAQIVKDGLAAKIEALSKGVDATEQAMRAATK